MPPTDVASLNALGDEPADGDRHLVEDMSTGETKHVRHDNLFRTVKKSLTLANIVGDTIAAQQDDYAPTGIDDATIIRATLTGDQDMTGIGASDDGRVLIIANADATDTLTLKHESASSTAANRFSLPNAQDFALEPDEVVFLLYDATTTRWRIIGGAGSGGGDAPWLREEKTADFTADSVSKHYHCNHASAATQLVATLPLTPEEGMLLVFTVGDNTGGLQIKENPTDQSPISSGGSDTVGDGTGSITLNTRFSALLSYEDGKWQEIGGGGGGLPWTQATGTTVTLAPGSKYYLTNAGAVTGTLQVGVFGDELVVKGKPGGGGWTVEAPTETRIIVTGGGVAGIDQTPLTKDYTVNDVDETTETIRIAGNHASEFYVGQSITLSDTDDDGTYTVASATNVAGNTEIVVDEDVVNGTDDTGTLSVTGSIQSVEDAGSARFLYDGSNFIVEPIFGNVQVV